MKRLTIYIIGAIVFLLSIVSCEQEELYLCPPAGNIPVDVVIHWDSVPSNMLSLPNDMTVHWYSPLTSLIASDMSVYGGRERLNASVYDVMCMDFNGNSNLAFRSNGTREDFEVYNIRMTGTYNDLVPQLPGGEITVAEAYPYQFYIDSRSQDIDLENVALDDTVTVHFYPKNVLREFTFLVYDVIGAKNMEKNGGAISGMSGSYFPASGKLASTPSTILFSRVEAIKDAQTSSRWTDEEKALFAAKDPNWASADTLVGWTRDWVIGKFVTFGPLDTKDHRFRLTVEAITKANNQFHGSWGYWHGEWENTVAAQIAGAMGENGTLEEQLAWRQRNGGYDIILYNDHRLLIPEGEGGNNSSGGGFVVDVDDWGDMVEVPVSGNTRSALRNATLRSSVNTYATIPDFVVNGIHTETDNWSYIFNEQYVYKPESGLIWDYYPKKIWPQSGTVDFYAYAPAGIRNFVPGTGLNDNGNDTAPPVLEYVMPYKDRDEPPPGTGEPTSPLIVDDNQEDLLVAVQSRPSPQTVAVPMSFHHAFSRVTVKAKIAQEYANYRVKVVRVDLRNVNTKGKLRLNKDNDDPLPAISTGIPMEQGDRFKYNSAAGNVTLWYDLSALASYRFNLLAPAVPIEEKYTTLLNTDDGIFVMPQVVQSNTAVYVEYDVYTISPTGGEQYYTSATKLLPFTTGFAFEIGKQYELQVILDIP